MGDTYIVRLEAGSWIDHVAAGDPGRTTKRENAEDFTSMADAGKALTLARTHRPYINATIETRD